MTRDLDLSSGGTADIVDGEILNRSARFHPGMIAGHGRDILEPQAAQHLSRLKGQHHC